MATNNMLHIREVTIADKDRIAEVIALATADLRAVYRPSTGGSRRETPGGEAVQSLVAVDSKCIIGVVEYCVETGSLYIRGLAVHPQHRRRGVGRQLVRAVEGIATREGKSIIRLTTIKETGNQDIFTKLGFTVVNAEPAEGFEGIDGQPVTKVHMCRTLP